MELQTPAPKICRLSPSFQTVQVAQSTLGLMLFRLISIARNLVDERVRLDQHRLSCEASVPTAPQIPQSATFLNESLHRRCTLLQIHLMWNCQRKVWHCTWLRHVAPNMPLPHWASWADPRWVCPGLPNGPTLWMAFTASAAFWQTIHRVASYA